MTRVFKRKREKKKKSSRTFRISVVMRLEFRCCSNLIVIYLNVAIRHSINKASHLLFSHLLNSFEQSAITFRMNEISIECIVIVWMECCLVSWMAKERQRQFSNFHLFRFQWKCFSEWKKNVYLLSQHVCAKQRNFFLSLCNIISLTQIVGRT